MKVLILGSGAREHVLGWKIAQSPLESQLFFAPGNGGTAELGKNIPLNISDFNAIGKFVTEHSIEMVVVGPEQPLVMGIKDFFNSDRNLKEVAVIGPGKSGAQLEGSKKFAKNFMVRYGIPTAPFKAFSKETLKEAKAFLREIDPPYVLKADGLAAGKGVLILNDYEQAERQLTEMFGGKFGDAGKFVVIEKFLKGIELSAFILTDGSDYLLLPEAKDYKRIGEGDSGLNTGGMGAISPVPFADKLFMGKVKSRIIQPTLEGLRAEKIKYGGFIFFGLMNVEGDPYVIEYNVRMGDPEAEVVVPRMRSDLLELFLAVAKGEIKNKKSEIENKTVVTVMMVSGGYPGHYSKGKEITGLDEVQESIVFHAGTKKEKGKFFTNGGRVLSLTSYGEDMKAALNRSYSNILRIRFDGSYFRKDIGFDL